MKIKFFLITFLAGMLPIAISTVQAEHHQINTDTVSTLPSQKNSSPTYVNSNQQAYAAMQELPKDEPLHMLNMIRYKDNASYKEGSEFVQKGWTGEQAYAEYTRHSSPIATRVGGKIAYLGKPLLTLIGPDHEKWDAVFIVSYPDLQSFLALVGDPEYKKHAFHRSAAVADSRLVRMAPVSIPSQNALAK